MKYLLLIYGDEAAMEASMAGMTPEQQAAQTKVWFDYGDWLAEKGWLVAGDALQATSTATVVRAPDGKVRYVALTTGRQTILSVVRSRGGQVVRWRVS